MIRALLVVAILLPGMPLHAQMKPDRNLEAESEHRRHGRHRGERERPAQERQTHEGPFKLDRARPDRHRHETPPSPAEQFQREQLEQRQPRR
jgi:hypothetical protein